jgi:branched-chain amino acid transport system ATP-binding protein
MLKKHKVTTGEAMIVVEDLHRHFGAFRAVDGASLEIATGSITGSLNS